MERASQSEKKEQTEWALREFCDELSLESISMFSSSGSLMVSSDPEIQQLQGVEWLFEILHTDVLYDLDFGKLTSIIIQDTTKCLIVKPIDSGHRGKRNAWYFVHGNISDMKGENLPQNLREQAEAEMIDEYSAFFEGDDRRNEIHSLFELPMVLGMEFEMNSDAVVLIDTEVGIIIDKENKPLWVVSRKLPEHPPHLLRRLDDMDEYIRTVIWDNSELGMEQGQEVAEMRPIPYELLTFILLYGILLMVFDPQIVLIILGAKIVVLIALATRKPSVTMWLLSIALILVGVIVILVATSEVVGYPEFISQSLEFLIFIPRGVYIFFLGNLFRILYGVELGEDDLKNK